jgi:hypothetical protein
LSKVIRRPPAERPRREAERGERVQEQAVLLEAVSAAPLPHQLFEDGVGREVDAAAEQDVEVLERDRLRVGGGQGTEQREGRRAGAVVADARQVGVEIEHGGEA